MAKKPAGPEVAGIDVDSTPASYLTERDLGRIYPEFMSGQHLPPLEKGEVEIARISLDSGFAWLSITTKRVGTDRQTKDAQAGHAWQHSELLRHLTQQ